MEEKTIISRRNVLKGLAACAAAVSSLGSLVQAKDAQAQSGKKVLVLYFSRTGNTEEFAKQVHKIVGGDIKQLKTIEPYPSDYDETTAQAKKEQEANFRPKINDIGDIRSYDIIFMGYPNWWGTVPMAFFTLFESVDLSGKIIAPFVTHEGSYMGNSVSDIRRSCPNSIIQEGLALRGRSAAINSSREITRWLDKTKLAQTLKNA